MKKLLSIILACAMIVSLFCVVPASATYNTTHQKFPYVFEDFEGPDGNGANGIVAGNASGTTVSVVTDATRGGHVLKGETANNTQGGPTLLSYAYKENEADTQESFLETFAAGETITINAWVKMGTVQDAARLRFIAFTTSSHVTLDATVPSPKNTTSWQKVSATYTFEAETTVRKIEMRLHATSQAAGNVIMYVDDLELKLDNRRGTTAVTTTPAGNKVDWVIYDGVIGNYQLGYFQNGMATNGNGLSAEIEGYDGAMNKVAKYQYSGAGVYNQMWLSQNGMRAAFPKGGKIEVSMWLKLSDVITADNLYYHFQIGTGSDVGKVQFSGKTTDWQYATGTLDITSDQDTVIYNSFTTNGALTFAAQSGSAPKTAAGADPIIYVDNFKMRAYTPLFEGTKQAPATEKFITKANGSAGNAAVGSNVYYWDSNVTSQNSSYSTTKHDGTTGNVYRLALAVSSSNLQQYFLNQGGSNKMTLAVGDEVKMSQWIKLETPATVDTIYYGVAIGSKLFGVPINGKSTDWQYVEATHTVTEAIEAGAMYHGYTVNNPTVFSDIYNARRPKDANGNVPVFQIDGYSLRFYTPGEITTGVTTIPVASNAVASYDAEGKISATYDFKTNMGVAIDAAANKSFYKLVGKTSGTVYGSAAAIGGLVYPASATEDIQLEIIPATADYVGDSIKVDIVDLSAFDGIQILDADDTFAEISTDTALEGATLIWVGYNDDDGYVRITGTATAPVDMDAYSEELFENEVDLGDWTFMKVFLWSDMSSTCAPLALAYEY